MGVHGPGIAQQIAGMLHRRPTVGLAVGVVDGGHLDLHTHGVADIASQEPITERTVFRIASITKTFTAIAVMQLVERGLVDLDAPAGEYVGSFRLIPAEDRFRPPTVRHLLTHTAGLPEVLHWRGAFLPDFGESVCSGEPLPSLAEFYGGGLRVVAQPGSRFVYTNHGPATLGALVAEVTGEPLDRYFRGHIFEPLGMTDTDLVPTESIRARLATGYEIGFGGVKAVAAREMVTAGAASVYSTARDMGRYLGALLDEGRSESGAILRPETLAAMFDAHYRPDPRIPGMGLGFFRSETAGRLTVGHQGTHPGFHSHILLAPGDAVGVMAFTNGAARADFWLPAEVSGLLRGVLGIGDEDTGDAAPHHPGNWADLCGWYRLEAGLTDVRLRGMIGAGAEVFVRGGRLMLRFLTPIPTLWRGFGLVPDDGDDPDVFRIEFPDSEMNPMRVVFARAPGGSADRLHLDLMPLTLTKQSAASNPRRWAAGALVGAAAAAVLRRRTGR